jgi:hypothetical protein
VRGANTRQASAGAIGSRGAEGDACKTRCGRGSLAEQSSSGQGGHDSGRPDQACPRPYDRRGLRPCSDTGHVRENSCRPES